MNRRALIALLIGGAAWSVVAALLPALPLMIRYILVFALFTAGPGAPALGITAGAPLLERLVVMLGVGTVAAPVMAEALARAGIVAAFPFVATALTAAATVEIAASRAASPPADRVTTMGCALVAALAIATSVIVFGAHRLEVRPDGVTVLGEYDSVDLSYYAAITGELSHQVPPEAPFYAGHPLNYSYYPQLLLAMVHRFGDVPILHLYFRYAWPGFLVLGAAGALMFVQRFTAPAVAVLATCLLLVGGDFSYVAARLLPHQSYEWDYLLWPTNFLAPTMEILHFSTWTPSLPAFFAGLYGLARFMSTRRAGWAALAAFCIAALVQFKPFAFAVLMVGIVAAATFTRDAPGRRRLAAVAIGSVVLAAPLLYRIAMLYSESRSRLRLDYFLLPRRMLAKLDVSAAVDRAASSLGASGWLHTPVVLILATALFLAGGLGVRWAGVPAVWRALRRGLVEASIWSVLAWTVLAGIGLPFVIVTEPYHDTLQFYQVALYLLWVFTAASILAVGRSAAAQAAAIGVVVLLAIPSSVHYLHEKSPVGSRRPLASLDRSDMMFARYLRQQDPDRTVVLHDRPLDPSLLSIASERRVVLAWARYVTGSEPRRVDVDRFFASAEGSPADALDILKEYRVTHVVERMGRDRIHPAISARLKPVIRTPDAVLYEVPPRDD